MSVPEEIDVLHVAGFDAYDNTHESGNYIVFNALRNLEHSSRMVIHQQKSFTDDMTFLLRIGGKTPEEIAKMLPKHKVLIIYGEDYTPKQLRAIYDEHKCMIIRVLMTHDFLSGGCSYPISPELFKVKYDPHHPKGAYYPNSWFHDRTLIPDVMHLDPREISCDGYTKNCSNCPESWRHKSTDTARQMIEDKKKYLSDLPIIIAGVSNFSLNLVKNSSVFKHNRTELLPIPNDIPYAAESKEELRKALGAPIDKKIILWGTTQPHNHRKGRFLASEALMHMWHRCDPEERQNIHVLNVGPPSPIPFHETQGFKVLGTGYVKNRQHMAKLYKLSDIALCTTISDAGPMMVSESMRNECPVIAFDRSVALDIVTSGINGYIIKNLDTVEMATRSLELLRDPNLEEISKKCPAGVEQHHNFERITQKWDSIINELIKDYDLNAHRNG